MTQGKTGNTRGRILDAAACSFAKQGYSGASTREIARLAKVNEITVYRYYPTKHDLFMATVEAEVQKLRIRPELVTHLVDAPDLHACLRGICELIGDLLMQQPSLVRLLQFGILEFGGAVVPLYRRYLGSVLDLGTVCLQRWTDAGQLSHHDSRVLILAFAATIVSLPTFYPAIWEEKLPLLAGQTLPDFYAGVWYRALNGEPQTNLV